jgi:hypothetical protein
MPEPLTSLFSIRNDTEKTEPIHILIAGNTETKGPPVRYRPLGVLLPEGAPEFPWDSPIHVPGSPSGLPIPTIRSQLA